VLGRIGREPVTALLAIWDRGRKVARLASNLAEKRRDHSTFGPIEFLRASFHDIPLPDRSVDAVVSVSAIEHSDKDVIVKAFAEMRRITRSDGPILVTTSATSAPDDVFHESTKSICFSRHSLLDLLGDETAPAL